MANKRAQDSRSTSISMVIPTTFCAMETVKESELDVDLANDKRCNPLAPIPADTVFLRHMQGEFDAVIALYHDQGHIAVKTLGFDRAANVTLRFPVVRTSVDHGTAFDIAWQGIAKEDSLVEAIRLASQLERGSRQRGEKYVA